MQMKAFAHKLESTLAAPLPSLSLHHAVMPLGLLGADDKQALAHQRAVRTAMKKDQDDLRSSVEKPAKLDDLEAITAALENLQISESVATCMAIPLPACMEVRLTTMLEVPFAVQDATGTVVVIVSAFF